MGATLIAATTRKNPGGTTSTIVPPAEIAAGDLLVVPWLAGASTAATTDHAAKGWWRYGARSVNTRSFAVYVRIYNPADPASVYTLTQGGSANAKWAELAVRGHSVTAEADIQVGASWIRGENGGSQGPLVALSLNAATSGLAFAFTGEASNALGGYTVTAANGFALAAEITEGPTAGAEIEWVTAWQKLIASGATGNLEITHGTNASLNGVGLQILIPAPGSSPASGRAASTSTVTGSPGTRAPATGAAASSTTVQGTAAARTPAAGTTAATTEASGSPGSRHPAVGVADAVSSTTGAPSARHPASGMVAALSTIDGTPEVLAPEAAEGIVQATSALTGSPESVHPIEGRIVGSSAITGAAVAQSPASGLVASESHVIGTPRGPRVSRMVLTPTSHRPAAPVIRSRPLPTPLARPRPPRPPIWPPA